MKKVLLFAAVCSLTACHIQQPPHGPQVYTTPGSQGGVSYSHYEVTPL